MSLYKNPAIVIGMALGGLGVTRSLAKQGVPVFCIDPRKDRFEMQTKFGQKLDFDDIKTDAFIDKLVALCESLPEKPVLFATIRIPATLLSEHRDKFKDIAYLNIPDMTHMDELENKFYVEKYAEQANLNVPQTFYIENAYDKDALSALSFPAVIKPDDNNVVFTKHFEKAKIVNSQDEIKEYVDAVLDRIPQMKMVVQEWIEGDDSALFFCLQYRNAENKVLGSFVGRKVMSWPRHVGRTCSCAPYDGELHDQIEAYANDFFNNIEGFRGFCSLEFKYDENRGKLYLIEPTVGRTDFQQEIASVNGVNMPLIAYQDMTNQLDQNLLSARSSNDTYWIDESVAKWARREPYNQALESSFAHKKAYFRWYDLGPYISMLKTKILGKLK